MSGVAWWTCAVLALAGARLYDRCELARDLQRYGVHRERVSTWVCIAFHESRFDTASRNPLSGDHGLLQISEVYWCGSGKACGLPCSALRDDDISDDVECALRIYEEHTRIQGDGFLAWVVYPQHCKHNTKKYLVDCDEPSKTTTAKTVDKPQARTYEYNSNVTFDLNPKIDELKPPYLSISSIVRGSYGNKFDDHDKHNKWLDFKIDDIDKLTLPMFNKKTSTAPPPVIPVRQIETDQFRQKLAKTSTPSPTATTVIKSYSSYFTTARTTTRSTTLSSTPTTTTYKPPTTKSTVTYKPTTIFRSPSTTPTAANVTSRAVISTTSKRAWYDRTLSKTLNKSTTLTPWSTARPTTTKVWSSTPRPTTWSWTTSKPIATSTIVAPTTKKTATTQSTPPKRTTQSIFDLYLNTRRPKLSTYKFAALSDSPYKLKIFSGGTTPAPSLKTLGREVKTPSWGTAHNQIRRQTLLNV